MLFPRTLPAYALLAQEPLSRRIHYASSWLLAVTLPESIRTILASGLLLTQLGPLNDLSTILLHQPYVIVSSLLQLVCWCPLRFFYLAPFYTAGDLCPDDSIGIVLNAPNRALEGVLVENTSSEPSAPRRNSGTLSRRSICLQGARAHAVDGPSLLEVFRIAKNDCPVEGSAHGLRIFAESLTKELNDEEMKSLIISLGTRGLDMLRSLCRHPTISCNGQRDVRPLLENKLKKERLSRSFLSALGLFPDYTSNSSHAPSRSKRPRTCGGRQYDSSEAAKQPPCPEAPVAAAAELCTGIQPPAASASTENEEFGSAEMQHEEFVGVSRQESPVFTASEAKPDPFSDYETRARTMSKVVRDYERYGTRHRWIACPDYDNDTGSVSDGKFAIVKTSEEEGESLMSSQVVCSCPHAIQAATESRPAQVASLFPSTVPVRQSCFHCDLVRRSKFHSTDLPPDGSYYVPLTRYPATDPAIRAKAFVHIENEIGAREQSSSATCSVTAGHICCSNCHNGKPQGALSDKYCQHVRLLVESAEGDSENEFDRMLFDLLNRSDDQSTPSKLEFDKSTKKWWYPSLSAKIDSRHTDQFGGTLPPMPRSVKKLLEDQTRRPSHAGGPGDPDTALGAQASALLVFAPPLPSTPTTPQSAECGCFYFDGEVIQPVECS